MSRAVGLPEKGYHGNQVSEILNKTIKSNIRKILLDHLKPFCNDESEVHFFKQNLDRCIVLLKTRGEEHLLAGFVHEVVERYNSKPHSGPNMFCLAPFCMDEAFSMVHVPRELPSLANNDNSPDAIAIREFRAEVADKYANNWEPPFFGVAT